MNFLGSLFKRSPSAKASTAWDPEDIQADRARNAEPARPPCSLDAEVAAATREVEALMGSRVRPSFHDPVLFLISIGPGGLLTMPAPDGGHVLLAFTSEDRWAHYRTTLEDVDGETRVAWFSASGLAGKAQALRSLGVVGLALDRCPYCTDVLLLESESMTDPEAILRFCAIEAVTRKRQFDRCLAAARAALVAGDVEAAVSIGQHVVTHVDAERPEVHLMLGECGLRRHDEALVDRKLRILERFGREWPGRLRALARESP